ncbi:DEKNAAC101032 [Brettanomyces naardenensis]|uniref:DEKNAAC101032 n=1 Tax=Brettanomyces naardenensis TaxID=13370 RepID=A0A448YH82_BRENA|nr:DEKNAAC101032 [Brettanomyces naardenensis]
MALSQNLLSIPRQFLPSVHSSPLGGLGLFYTGPTDRDITLLSVPSNFTLSIYQCKRIMDSGIGEDGQFAKNFIQKCLSFYCTGKVTESRILICYCISMLALDKVGKLKSLEAANFVPEYLQVLLKTTVDNIDFDNKSLLEFYKEEFQGNSLLNSVYLELTNGDAEEFAKFIRKELKDDDCISGVQIQQLITAIRSRILEIPRSDHGDEDNFVTDITLVPLLDFSNHDNYKVSAYFDVDRKNSDVLLKLDHNKFSKEAEDEEIFISYSKTEDINRFFLNYGFIPKSRDDWKVFEIPFWGYYSEGTGITEILYRIGQTPNLQFGVKFDEKGEIKDLKINLMDNYSFLVLMKGIDWKKYLGDEDVAAEEDDKEVVGEDVVANLMEEATIEQINEAVYEMVEMINGGMKRYRKKLENFMVMIDEYEIGEEETKNISELIKFELEFSRKFTDIWEKIKEDTNKEKANNNNDGEIPNSYETALSMILSPDEVDETWAQVRMFPIYNFEEAEDERVKMEEMKLDP